MSASEGNQGDSHADKHAHGPPPPAEPQTPMWLPALGALLFLTVGLVWALSKPAEKTPDLSGIPAGTATATAPAGGGAAPSRGPGGEPHGGH